MATVKQIEANRRNAQQSTGPRTETGKSVSRLNALKSGIDAELDIIPGEDPAALKKLVAEYLDRFQPTTPEARFLVDTLITNDWLLRRLRSAEAALWTDDVENTFKHSDGPLACAAANQDQTFERLQRRMDAVQRNYRYALTALERLQTQPSAARPSARPAPELTLVPASIPASPVPAVAPPAPTPIGFVPPESPIPVPEARATVHSGCVPAQERS